MSLTGPASMDLTATRSIVSRVTGLLVQVQSVGRDIQASFPPPGSFGQIGSAAEAASQRARSSIAQTVTAVASLLRSLNGSVLAAASPTAPTAKTPTAKTPTTTTASAAPAGLGWILAAAVRQAGAGQPAEPHSVARVLNDLTAVSGTSGNPPPATALTGPAGFAGWLTPQNQASVGLVQVAAGDAGATAMRPGDVVVGAMTPGDPIVGIVGDDRTVYNGGPIGPVSAFTSVQGVYRPISSQSALWGTRV